MIFLESKTLKTSRIFIMFFFIFTLLFNFSFSIAVNDCAEYSDIGLPTGNTISGCTTDSTGYTLNNNTGVLTGPSGNTVQSAQVNTTRTDYSFGNQYTLLEPVKLNGSQSTSSKIEISDKGFTSYINSILKYIYQLIALSAIFFLIYGGVEYLTSDLINKKSEGKETIQRVITGLIFVFTVWLIFNTINPDLLKTEIFNIGTGPNVATGPTSGNTGTTGGVNNSGNQTPIVSGSPCTSGLVNVQGSYQLCSTVANKMIEMIAAAAKDGVTLTLASAYRPIETQIALRKKNCGTSDYAIYSMPARDCSPQTAIPGTSNHEKGIAVDIQEARSTGSAAYNWLVKNAATYGFYNDLNATKEPWHWSTTGRK
jgi:hypothetical protein